MDILRYKEQHILILGNKKTALSICVCLLQAGHRVTLFNRSAVDVAAGINQHLADLRELADTDVDTQNLEIVNTLDSSADYDMAIAITNENIGDKHAMIHDLENTLADDALIAINSESIALSTLQLHAKHPERIIGANWVEPVHTSYFLEIITNVQTNQQLVQDFYNTAKELWQKDPYILKSDRGIRAKMMSALIREAFYLVENNYVTVEDIDRACRNDAGYYLPFAGNFRYMDLMGTFMYGVVMQDLNPELSKNTHIPKFCQDLIDQGDKGMATGKGFYNYAPGEAAEWEATFRKFSYQIQQIISKYPFQYKQEAVPVIPVFIP
jgi:3-hydroxybutyryl-CoA dehydrogenase